ncbi:MAG: tetratricopeptide repeat protein, partial [Planctomycetota bacterium]
QENKLRVEIAPMKGVKVEEDLEIQVVVRNLGVGHTFPGGTNDSNESWLEVQVLDEKENVLAQSGWLEPDGHLSKEAHTFGATIIDRHGERIARRNAKDIYVNAQVNVIPPGTADVARYRIRMPEDAVTVRARLLWRKFNRGYTEFTFAGGDVPELPITEIASAEVRLPHGYGPEARDEAWEDWTRHNDLGIGLLRQGDSKHAEASFAEVDRLAPDRPDGPLNLARVNIAEANYPAAVKHLRRLGNYDEALEAFARTLKDFPSDRNTHSEVGLAYFTMGEMEKSLESWLRVLEIDPEDRNAHFHRMKIYKNLGRDADAEEAKKAFERYRIDENAPAITNDFLRRHPDVNREAQKIHVHELVPPK